MLLFPVEMDMLAAGAALATPLLELATLPDLTSIAAEEA